MPTSRLPILLLTLLLLLAATEKPSKLQADDCPDDTDHCQIQLTTVYLPVIVSGAAMSSVMSPLATATPVVPPPVN